jgi:hypothetical protein
MTNADKIRAMTDEELAKLIYDRDGCGFCIGWKNIDKCCGKECEKVILESLQQEDI